MEQDAGQDAAFETLTRTLTKQPLHTEIYRKTLLSCRAPKTMEQIEDEIERFAEFGNATQSQGHFLDVLVDAGALERIELDESGEAISFERKEGLSEDELEDLVATWLFMTTPLGERYARENSPERRMAALFDEKPDLVPLYQILLAWCAQPRSYTEISSFVSQQTSLSDQIATSIRDLDASTFVSELEKAGGLVWDGGWIVTEEGETFIVTR